MKNTFLYLLVFSLLFNVFQYVNSSKILKAKDAELTSMKKSLTTSNDSIAKILDNDIFDLDKDDDAQEYFYQKDLDFNKIKVKVSADIDKLNANTNGSSLVPYEPINGKKFLINRTKFINHRWIIAEFTNGELWGQVLLKYFVQEGKDTDFEIIDTVLHNKPLKE